MSKLILIANRLPVTAESKKTGELIINPSVGGLATGMSSVAQSHQCIWVGYSGIATGSIPPVDEMRITETLIRDFNSYAVPLTEMDIELYYNGFANKTIWPLFHYFPFFTSFNEETWRSYVAVNDKFFDPVASLYEPGDIIWIHDYHLMLLPGIIRRKIPDAKIGFFLHIPFPSYEVFRLLPWRREILMGIIGSDLIGFHTFGYVRHFLSSVQRLIGIEHAMGQMTVDNRTVKCDTFPMGIDFQRYSDYMSNKKISREIDILKKSYHGIKIILSMDRLDFTKGIIERLNSYERFLEKYPEFHGNVQMIIVTVPSRVQVDTYIKLRKLINERVGRINGKYNTLSWSPIQYLYRSLTFEMIMTLYHCADVCLVTPLRDGMNLVAKEYVAARVNNDGVLILSEMAGVSEELGEALIVNPNNREEVADSIAAALTMHATEQHRRIAIMKRRVQRNDVYHWASTFIEKLFAIKNDDDLYRYRSISVDNMKTLVAAYHESHARLLLLDYDGTLVPFVDIPDMAVPDSELVQLIASLSENESTDIAIISGRNFEFLERHFARLPLTLVAEHGGWIKIRGEGWKEITSVDTQWKTEIRSILESYCDRTPGTFIEEKEFSLAWHYRRSDTELIRMRVMELKGNLLHMIANHNLGIMEGNNVLEIKSLEISKGKIANFMLSAKRFDFILAIGDDATDEDLFTMIPEYGYTIKVGYNPSKARYTVAGVRAVRQLLKQLISV